MSYEVRLSSDDGQLTVRTGGVGTRCVLRYQPKNPRKWHTPPPAQITKPKPRKRKTRPLEHGDTGDHVCVECGQVFKPRRSDMIICSFKCRLERNKRFNRRRHRSNRTPKFANCRECGQEFRKRNRAVTCSEACSADRKRRKSRERDQRKRQILAGGPPND